MTCILSFSKWMANCQLNCWELWWVGQLHLHPFTIIHTAASPTVMSIITATCTGDMCFASDVVRHSTTVHMFIVYRLWLNKLHFTSTDTLVETQCICFRHVSLVRTFTVINTWRCEVTWAADACLHRPHYPHILAQIIFSGQHCALKSLL